MIVAYTVLLSLNVTTGSLWWGWVVSGKGMRVCTGQVRPPSVEVSIHTSLVSVPGPGAVRSSLAAVTTLRWFSGLMAMKGSCWAKVVLSVLARTLGERQCGSLSTRSEGGVV